MAETFSKLLVAKYSPENKCDAPDGTVLFVLPRKTVPIKPHVSHYFLSSADRTTRSRYAWVRSHPKPFTLDDFIADYLSGESLTDDARRHLRLMLSAADRLLDDNVVAASYSQRGIETKEMAFDVHRVIFHRASKRAAS